MCINTVKKNTEKKTNRLATCYVQMLLQKCGLVPNKYYNNNNIINIMTTTLDIFDDRYLRVPERISTKLVDRCIVGRLAAWTSLDLSSG